LPEYSLLRTADLTQHRQGSAPGGARILISTRHLRLRARFSQ
jgi:hypothetical protein